MSTEEPTLQRRIYFYYFKTIGFGEVALDPIRVFKELTRIPLQRGRVVQLKEEDPTETVVAVDQISENTIHGRLLRLKKSDLPTIAKLTEGIEEDGITLEDDEALSFTTHFVVTKIESGKYVLAAERNKDAHSIGVLKDYLPRVMTRVVKDVKISHLVRKDIEQDFKRAVIIRKVKVRIPVSTKELIEDTEYGPGAAIAATVGREGNVLFNSTEITLQWHGAEKRPLSKEQVFDWFRKIIKRKDSTQNPEQRSLYKKMKTFQAVGEDANGLPVIIDLLEPYLFVTRKIVKRDMRTKAVNRSDMYNAIESGFLELFDFLPESYDIKEKEISPSAEENTSAKLDDFF